jgi:hypothetical protein
MFTLFAAGAVQYPSDVRRPIHGGPFLLAMGFFTILFVGLRYEVGGDWLNYLDILDGMRYQHFWAGVWKQDPGYGLLNWLTARIGFGIWFVNLVCAILFVWGVMKFARQQPNPWLVFVVAAPYLIIVVAMGYVRQGVAIGFIVAGLSVLDRGILRFLVYMALAASFHKSAVVVLPFVALSASRHRIVTAVISFFSIILLYYLFIQASVDKLVTNYVVAAYASQGAGIRVAMNLPPAILFLVFQRRFVGDEQTCKLWRNFSIAALVALALLEMTTATTAVDRLALYLIPLQMFVLGRLPFAFGDRGRPSVGLTLAVIVYSAAIQFVWLTYADNSDSWLPYQWYPLAQGSES